MMLEVLPDDTLLPSGFHSVLTAGCAVRVLAVGTRRAVLCMRDMPVVRDVWTSDKNDDELAHGVLTTIRRLYDEERKMTDEAISVRVRSDETALHAAVEQRPHTRLLGYTKHRAVDGQAAQTILRAAQCTSRAFTEQEFTQWVHDDATYYAHLLVSVGEASDVEATYAKVRGETEQRLAQGMHTPGFLFRNLLDEDGTLLGRLWFDVDAVTHLSYCYKFMVEDGYRGKGVGKVLLAAWEAEAARLGATTMALHVYDQNQPACRLYAAYGFETDANTYELMATSKVGG